jgi:subtilase family serine protease
MRRRDLSLPRFLLLHFCLFFIPIAAWPQAPSSQSRVVEPVNEGALVTLRGNTHPLAQPQFDRGAAPPDLPMARMLLVLKRSDAQEAALQKLLDDQQDLNSASYHQWLTPDDFGQQFGPSDQDIQAVAAWLRSHGFQIGAIGRGRTVIEFSGTAGQLQQAFHTEIHKYTVNGEDHWANAVDPQIPTALAPAVAGVNSLHNLPKKPMYRLVGKSSKPWGGAASLGLGSEFTIPASQCSISGNCYFVGPYDFAMIYNVLPLWNAATPIDGAGQSIAILGESNINIQDVRDFRSIFGLPANDPQVILNGPDPGLVPGLETEADLDVEWSGAVAKAATIKLVVTAPTNSTDGVDLSAVYAVENSVAPTISESFGECELFLGNAGNSFQNGIRQQAAAQGITFINSSGDEGSARCDPSGNNTPAPATHGLAVSGLASSPNGVAVGGTDFQNFGASFKFGVASPYWNLTNNANQASAISYIPETTWNENCTNNVFVILKAGTSAEASCNNPQLANAVETGGGGGGKSACITSNGSDPSSCSVGYAKPAWQSAPGVPVDGVRDIPDISLFASPGFMDSAYILCESDLSSFTQPCSLNSPFNTFWGIGGTSASAPAFAGIVALVNQFTGSSGQGNANYVLYRIASSSAQTSRACGATSNPSSGCIFYDVTSGTNEAPCTKGSPNCNTSVGSDLYGVLAGYSAASGYDLATGLGSMNAFNLVHNWIQPTTPSTTTLSLNGGAAVNITHGQNVSFSIAVTPSSATGVVSLMGSPSGSGFSPLASFPLQNGAVSGTTASLAGGTSYAVKAHYPGNGTYTPSDSAPVTVTVTPEPSKTLITIPVFDPSTGKETGDNPSSVVYGSPYIARVDVGNANATVAFPMMPICPLLSCASGRVTLSDSVSGGASGVFLLNNQGYSEDLSIQLSGGTHQLSASYAGDNSYGPSSGSYTLVVKPAATQMSVPSIPYSPEIVGTPVNVSSSVITNLFVGAAPTGTITFLDGTSPIQGAVTLSGIAGSSGQHASLSGSIAATFTTPGTHSITAQYSGDANYAAATSTPWNASVFYATTMTETASPTPVNLGQSVIITAIATSIAKSPPMTGTFQFGSSLIPGPITPTLSTDANGNQVLTATVTMTPPYSGTLQVVYSGDSNFEGAVTYVYVNVILPNFEMATNSSSLTIPAGQSGSTMLTVTPQTNITSSVALSCNLTSLAGASCSFNPASPLNLTNSAAASTMVTVTTLAPSSSPTTTLIAIPCQRVWRIPPPNTWMVVIADGLAISLLFLLAGQESNRLATRFGIIGFLCLVLGCGAGNGGGGGGGAGGGGGGGGQSPTTLTLTTSAVKVPYGTNLSFSVSVHSTQSVTGTVDLWDSSTSTSAGLAASPVVNGTATFQISYLTVGTHMISAQYHGDSNNQPSKTSGSINQTITGTAYVFVTGTSPGLNNSTPLNVTIQ